MDNPSCDSKWLDPKHSSRRFAWHPFDTWFCKDLGHHLQQRGAPWYSHVNPTSMGWFVISPTSQLEICSACWVPTTLDDWLHSYSFCLVFSGQITSSFISFGCLHRAVSSTIVSEPEFVGHPRVSWQHGNNSTVQLLFFVIVRSTFFFTNVS